MMMMIPKKSKGAVRVCALGMIHSGGISGQLGLQKHIVIIVIIIIVIIVIIIIIIVIITVNYYFQVGMTSSSFLSFKRSATCHACSPYQGVRTSMQSSKFLNQSMSDCLKINDHFIDSSLLINDQILSTAVFMSFHGQLLNVHKQMETENSRQA